VTYLTTNPVSSVQYEAQTIITDRRNKKTAKCKINMGYAYDVGTMFNVDVVSEADIHCLDVRTFLL